VHGDPVEFDLQQGSALNLPAAWAATTLPVAVAPAGITVLPSTSTGVTTEAVKVCPVDCLSNQVSPRRTVRTVPPERQPVGCSRTLLATPHHIAGRHRTTAEFVGVRARSRVAGVVGGGLLVQRAPQRLDRKRA